MKRIKIINNINYLRYAALARIATRKVGVAIKRGTPSIFFCPTTAEILYPPMFVVLLVLCDPRLLDTSKDSQKFPDLSGGVATTIQGEFKHKNEVVPKL